jgi:FkbM family methyltransferase
MIDWSLVNRVDEGSFRYLMKTLVRRDSYGIRGIEFEPDFIIDIGGNIGIFSIVCRDRWKNSRIISVEGNKATGEILRSNSIGRDIEVIVRGIGRESGKEIRIIDRSGSDTHVVCEECGGEGNSISIGDVIEEKGLDIVGSRWIMKIDCEGCEDYIFPELEIVNKAEVVMIEFHNMHPPSSEMIASKFVEGMLVSHEMRGSWRVRSGKGKVGIFTKRGIK